MSDIRGERSVVIAAPLDEVFNYVSDFSRHHEWNYQILEITKLTAGEVGVGTRFRAQEQPPDSLPTFGKLIFPVMIKIVGMSKVTEAEITRWEPEREIAWKAVSRARGDQTWMSSEWSLTLEYQNDATRVTQKFHMVPEHNFSKKMMSNEQQNAAMVGDEVTSNLGQLKEIMERTSH